MSAPRPPASNDAPDGRPQEAAHSSVADIIEAQAYSDGRMRLADLGRGARAALRREGVTLPDEDALEPET